MHRVLLLVLLMMAAVSPAAAQSCATLGSQPDCRPPPAKQPAKQPTTPPQTSSTKAPRAERDVQMQGYSETTVSNYGVSTTLENRVIDHNGIVEFGFRGSTQKPCRRPGYGTLCE